MKEEYLSRETMALQLIKLWAPVLLLGTFPRIPMRASLGRHTAENKTDMITVLMVLTDFAYQ